MEVLVGQKPTANYVMAVGTAIANGGTATIKARGKAISRAVAVAERARKIFNVVVQNIEIGSETLTLKSEVDTRNIRVSTIAITVGR